MGLGFRVDHDRQKPIPLRLTAAAWTTSFGLDTLSHAIEELVAANDLVAARVVASGSHHGTFLGTPPTGVHVAVDQALSARVRDGRIVELWEIVDTGSGSKQLGLLADQNLGFDPGREWSGRVSVAEKR